MTRYTWSLLLVAMLLVPAFVSCKVSETPTDPAYPVGAVVYLRLDGTKMIVSAETYERFNSVYVTYKNVDDELQEEYLCKAMLCDEWPIPEDSDAR